MDITVIVCTYNRCQSLAKTLGSLVLSVLPGPTKWEVLVVDNNSTDETRAVVREYGQKYPGRFRYLFEPCPGKSHALRAGIQNTQSEIIAFTDDDVSVETTWLQNLTRNLHNCRWVGSGGRILPEQTFCPPRWLPVQDRYGLAPLALFDLGSEAGPLNESPFGANMAFQRKIFQKYDGFRTDLGPRPGSEIRNEDTEFGQRLLSSGEALRYEPQAIVYHSIPEKRIQKNYFLRWWFDKARADARQFAVPSSSRWAVDGVPLYLFRRLAVWSVRWVIALSPSRRFSNKIKAWTVMGQIAECHRLARERRRKVVSFHHPFL